MFVQSEAAAECVGADGHIEGVAAGEIEDRKWEFRGGRDQKVEATGYCGF